MSGNEERRLSAVGHVPLLTDSAEPIGHGVSGIVQRLGAILVWLVIVRSVYPATWKVYHPMSAASASAVEEGPAFPVAKPLIVEHKVANLGRKLRTLPSALFTTHVVALVWIRRSTDGSDGIRRRPELVVRHMGHGHRVTGRAGRFRGWPGRLPGRTVRGEGGGARLRHRYLATCPGVCLGDRLTRTLVSGTRLLEAVQHVLRAGRSQSRKQPMMAILKGATATARSQDGGLGSLCT